MWPPSSEDSLFARRIIAIAFQRMSERTRRSIAGSPGSGGSSSAVDRVDVGGRPHVLDCGALVARTPDYALDQVMGPLRAVLLHDGVEGLEPLLSLDCVDIGHFEQTTHETHMAARDRENLGMDRPITRRDFLDGVAIGAGALTLGGFLQACDLGGGGGEPGAAGIVRAPRTSPVCAVSPTRSFEIPHRLRDGTFWESAPEPGRHRRALRPGHRGRGISAAWPRRATGSASRVTTRGSSILDPLEQPGGHAAQNNFTANGDGGGARTLIGYGGSQTIDSPSAYARPAAELLRRRRDRGRELQPLLRPGFNKRFGPRARHLLRRGDLRAGRQLAIGTEREILRTAPLSRRTKLELARLELRPPNPYADLSDAEAKAELAKLTYREFLERFGGPRR